MKTRKLTTHLLPALVFVFLLLGCSKEDGAIGPQGPIGLQGEQGPAGPQGDQGETGAANVIYSPWIPTELPFNITSATANFNIDAPLLTAEIIDSGVILVYGRTGINNIYGLPVTFNTAEFNESHFFRFRNPGVLSIRINSLDGLDIGERLLDDYRYILIPGGTSSSGKSTVDYSKMSYEEIVARFNIPI